MRPGNRLIAICAAVGLGLASVSAWAGEVRQWRLQDPVAGRPEPPGGRFPGLQRHTQPEDAGRAGRGHGGAYRTAGSGHVSCRFRPR
ncbi:hypothetical protein G6F22_021908 [Rhizopus arrhizus]|nr:hypothetical protein G6F22_021908 [Rhizopus arrhizus]